MVMTMIMLGCFGLIVCIIYLMNKQYEKRSFEASLELSRLNYDKKFLHR